MSTETTARQPKGVPVGGQFATTTLAESGTTLEPVKDWGAVNLRVGSQTPWGKADDVRELGPGIVSVGTPSHGGIRLSPQRNRAIPSALRNSDGWYEEDAAAAIVGMTFPEECRPRRATGYARDADFEEFLADCTASVQRWSPDGYEEATGEVLAPGQSHVKDERLWRQAHTDDQVVVSAITSETHPGMVELMTTVGGARTTESFDASRTFLVPTETYRAGRSWPGFVVDPALYEDITKPKVPKTVLPRFRGVHFAGMSAVGEARSRKALSGRWQSNDGTVRILAHVIAEDGISGKSSHVEDGRRTYYLKTRTHAEDSGSTVYAVPKALFDAMDAPDERTPRDLARDEWKLADYALTKAREARDHRAVQAAQLKAAAARRTYDNTSEN